jgi:mersacidin/lichenicidin family type 2 lantibiotic
MSQVNVIRAWKDQEYRLSLSAAERALLPDDPAGAIELTDADLGGVAGGMPPTCEVDSCYGCTWDGCTWVIMTMCTPCTHEVQTPCFYCDPL